MIAVVRHPPVWLKHVLQLLPPVLVAVLFLWGASKVDHGEQAEPCCHMPTPVPVMVVQPTQTPENPIRIVNLDVEPDVVLIGGQGTLHNGICNESRQTVNVQMYLGAQRVGIDPLLAETIDLAGRNTPEGRLSRNILPGCFGTEPFTDIVDPRLRPGRWVLNLVVYVPGYAKPVTSSSPVFEVRPAQ